MKISMVTIVLLLSLFVSCKRAETDSSSSAPEFQFRVKVVEARRETFQKSINYKGSVMAWQTANISPEVSGRIAKILARVGQEVKAGDLLATMDLTTLSLQQKQAQAVVDLAARGLQDARLNHERMEKLFEKRAVSSFQMEKARLALDSAQSQMASAQAALDLIGHTLEMSQMRAPFAGIISGRKMEEGDQINPMMGVGQSVLELLDLRRIKVVVDMTADDIGRIEVGGACRVKVSNLERDFVGAVYSKNIAADPVAKTFRAEIAVDNAERLIKANLFAEVWFEVAREEAVVVLPITALLDDSFVMIVEAGRAKRIQVVKGLSNGSHFVVEQGVEAGQRVIVEGNYDLQEGQTVVY